MATDLFKYNVLAVTDLLDRPEHALLSGLFKAGINIDIICNPNYDRLETLQKAGMTVYPHRIRHRLDITAIRFIRKRVKSKNYRIIYAIRNNALTTSLFAAAGTKVKIVGYRGTTGHLGLLRNPESWISYRNPRMDKIICVSNAVKQYLMSKNVPPSKLTTIYKGHDVSWYQPIEENAEAADLPIPPGAFVVGFVGNVRPVKGVVTLLQSVQYIPEDKNIYFVIIGHIRDSEVRRMMAVPAVTRRVYFAGYQKNATELMRRFSVFVMPSVAREGLPRALLEAMAQKIPPLVSNVGGLPEIIKNHENGLIVPPRDPKKLAEAILFLFNNPEHGKRLGEHAKTRIEKDFNIHNTIQETNALFDQLAEKG
jgi:glycosyltransferase involved in cell wall biosynthesis